MSMLGLIIFFLCCRGHSLLVVACWQLDRADVCDNPVSGQSLMSELRGLHHLITLIRSEVCLRHPGPPLHRCAGLDWSHCACSSVRTEACHRDRTACAPVRSWWSGSAAPATSG